MLDFGTALCRVELVLGITDQHEVEILYTISAHQEGLIQSKDGKTKQKNC